MAVIEHPEHMNYQKVMKAVDEQMKRISDAQMELQEKVMAFQEQLRALVEAKELIHKIWLEDHPDNRG